MSTLAANPSSGAVEKPSPLFWRVAVAAVVLFTLFFQLGARGLSEPDEGRFAEVGREMAVTGDYLTPRLNGVDHLSKPPVTYWLIALSVKMFGANEFAARLPAALAALGTLIAVYLLARSARGGATALWTVMVLLSSAMFLGMARVITTDILLTCFVTWSVWSFWWWYASDDRRWSKLVWFYVFLGLGMLTKGPVAVVLPLFAVAGLRWRNRSFRLKQMRWGWGTLIFLAVAAPWFVAIASTKPDLWRYFLVRETFERVATTAHRRSKAWWYFFPLLAGGFLPWTMLLAGAGVLRGEPGKIRELCRMCAAWVVLGLVMFSVSQSKLPSYALPLFPPLAVLAGAIVAKSAESRNDGRLRVLYFVAALVFLAAVIGLLPQFNKRFEPPGHSVALMLSCVGIGTAVCVVALAMKRTALCAGALSVTSVAVLLALFATIPLVERQPAVKAPAKYFAARIRQEDPTGRSPVLSYREFMRGLPFYLNQLILWYRPPVAGEEDVFEFTAAPVNAPHVLAELQPVRDLFDGSQRVFCITTTNHWETMSRELDRPLYKLEQMGRWLLVSNQP